MKRLVVSVIILITIICFSFSIPVYLENTTTQLTNKIEEINTDINNNDLDSALLKTQQLSKLWSSKKDIIGILVNNDEIDTITYNISRLAPLLKYKDLPMFCSNLDYIKSIIASVYNDDVPSWDTIL